MSDFEMMQRYRQVWLQERATADLPTLQVEALAAYGRGFFDALKASLWTGTLEPPQDAAPQAGKTRTAPTIAEEHPEKPAVAAMAAADEITHLRMQLGYIATELMQRGDERTLPEIIETAATAVKSSSWAHSE